MSGVSRRITGASRSRAGAFAGLECSWTGVPRAGRQPLLLTRQERQVRKLQQAVCVPERCGRLPEDANRLAEIAEPSEADPARAQIGGG